MLIRHAYLLSEFNRPVLPSSCGGCVLLARHRFGSRTSHDNLVSVRRTVSHVDPCEVEVVSARLLYVCLGECVGIEADGLEFPDRSVIVQLPIRINVNLSSLGTIRSSCAVRHSRSCPETPEHHDQRSGPRSLNHRFSNLGPLPRAPGPTSSRQRPKAMARKGKCKNQWYEE